jgi:hypothetical protein
VLCISPRNLPEDVDAFLDYFQLDPNAYVTLTATDPGMDTAPALQGTIAQR